MNPLKTALASLACAAAGAGIGYWRLRRRGVGSWIWPCLRHSGSRNRRPRPDAPVHLLLCIADHFEPKLYDAGPAVARRRVQRWLDEYPALFGRFRDSDGRAPRHTFFYPEEQYESEHLDALAQLCRDGHGEVEVHLHHDHDTASGLRDKLLAFKQRLAERHGLLARDRGTGAAAYGFIHGNWALCNSRPDGRWCGVNEELDILRETGCYADFTLPSAPQAAQTRTINSIYYAVNRPGKRKSHDAGTAVGSGPQPDKSLLLIQGPLLLNWSRRKWGVLPRIENACLQGNQAPTLDRLKLWLRARVQVPARPDWFFVKLHTHGCKEANLPVLLGEPMVRFHQELARLSRENRRFHFHYVTAREMYNLAKAAEAGWPGSVDEARDFQLRFAGACPSRSAGIMEEAERHSSPGVFLPCAR